MKSKRCETRLKRLLYNQTPCDVMTAESRRSRAITMETGGLPLVSTFALLTIVAGKQI